MQRLFFYKMGTVIMCHACKSSQKVGSWTILKNKKICRDFFFLTIFFTRTKTKRDIFAGRKLYFSPKKIKNVYRLEGENRTN